MAIITNRINNAIQALRGKPTQQNSMGADLARKFMKYGNGGSKPLVQNWSDLVMEDRSNYTGYMYAAINNRGNAVAQLAETNLVTLAKPELMEKAAKADGTLVHPYLDLINNSTAFSNYKFWYGISAFLDLAGVYYLMVIRATGELSNGRSYTSQPKEFVLLNPFDVKRIVNQKTGELGGYAEQRDGRYREIPADMIIEIKKFNPFSYVDPFPTVEAAKDSQFTMKQSGDFARHALHKNINSPGIITVGDNDLVVDEQEFANFKARIMGHEKGEPIFGVGDGALKWDPMQIDLDKAALTDISEINLNGIIAVTGSSKTMLGIEQSGVTRDTARVQKDLFVGNHVMPQLQLITDALNMDYQKNYQEDWEANEYRIAIDSPLKTDRDAESKDTEIKTSNFELYDTLVKAGYEPEIAAKYVEGKIDLETLSANAPEEPEEEEENPPTGDGGDAAEGDSPDEEEKDEGEENQNSSRHRNALGDDTKSGLIEQQQSSLQNAIANLEAQMVADAIRTIQNKEVKAKNQTSEEQENLEFVEDELITEAEQREYQRELEVILAAFYGVVFLLWTPKIANDRLKEFQLQGDFKLDSAAKNAIKEIAKKSSTSHVKTVNDTIYKEVRKMASSGASQQEIISKLTQKYTEEISKSRAKAIARTETNRAFTMSQYEYDRQFLKQNADYFKQTGQKAYKQWRVRSSNPCNFCLSLEARGAIPFDEAFADIGDELSVTTEVDGITKVSKMIVSFATPVAGNLHVNCGCDYTLIIK